MVLCFFYGCSATKFGMNEMVKTGNIGFDEVDAGKGLYRVIVLNAIDFDWDGGDRVDRDKVVAHFLADKCKATQVLSDVPLELGTYTFTTKKKIKHSMTVQCLN